MKNIDLKIICKFLYIVLILISNSFFSQNEENKIEVIKGFYKGNGCRKEGDINYPLVCLTVSGGHNEIYHMKDMFDFTKV